MTPADTLREEVRDWLCGAGFTDYDSLDIQSLTAFVRAKQDEALERAVQEMERYDAPGSTILFTADGERTMSRAECVRALKSQKKEGA